MADYTQCNTRTAFADGLMDLMAKDPRVVLVSADSIAVFRAAELKEKFPDRVIEAGIAEQNAVLCAAGLATAGFIPFVCTYAGFSTMRACEQMRTFVGYPNLNVKFFGANGGLYSGEREGVTHQFYEDLGIMRSVIGFKVIAPADAAQTIAALNDAYENDGPVYVRIGSGRDITVYDDNTLKTALKADVLCAYGNDALIIGCGGLLHNAKLAAEALKEKDVNVTVVNSACVKPLDEATLLPLMEACKMIVTIEDHNIIGGLGSAVCELAADHPVASRYPLKEGNMPCRVTRLGLRDVYPESGPADEVIVKYGMGVEHIVEAVMGNL